MTTVSERNYTGDYLQEWETEQATIVQADFDYDLKVFDVYNTNEAYLGSIVPSTIEEMEEMIGLFNSGVCPIYDCWDDGLGNTVSSLGFNDFQNDF